MNTIKLTLQVLLFVLLAVILGWAAVLALAVLGLAIVPIFVVCQGVAIFNDKQKGKY